MASDLTINLGAGTVGRRQRAEAWKIHLIDTGLDALTGGRVLRLAPLSDWKPSRLPTATCLGFVARPPLGLLPHAG
jgi:hypothetical protein